jgi:hypothetical protein
VGVYLHRQRGGPGHETFEKHPLLPNSGVPDNRDLRQASTGSNFNPPPTFGGLILKILNVWMPVPMRFSSGWLKFSL